MAKKSPAKSKAKATNKGRDAFTDVVSMSGVSENAVMKVLAALDDANDAEAAIEWAVAKTDEQSDHSAHTANIKEAVSIGTKDLGLNDADTDTAEVDE